MPAYSFTAPHVTPEMEQVERDNVPEHVWYEIQSDLYGWGDMVKKWGPGCGGCTNLKASLHKLPPIPDGAVDQLHIELHRLPLIQSQDYFHAKEKVPDLVEQESAAENFLRCEKFDCEAAAKRLAHYWKVRRQIFGSHRAFLPMTLDDDGALAEDRGLLQSGFLAVHPKDENGRTVLSVDRIKAVLPFASRDAALRSLFFMVHLLLVEDPLIQVDGCICLVNIKGFDLYRHFDRLMSKHISIILFHCMPIKFSAMHLLASTTAQGVLSLVLPSMKQVMGKECRLRMTVHTGTDWKMMETLKPFGITSRSVSEALGGDFTPSDFAKWWEERTKGSTARRAIIQSGDDAEHDDCIGRKTKDDTSTIINRNRDPRSPSRPSYKLRTAGKKDVSGSPISVRCL